MVVGKDQGQVSINGEDLQSALAREKRVCSAVWTPVLSYRTSGEDRLTIRGYLCASLSIITFFMIEINYEPGGLLHGWTTKHVLAICEAKFIFWTLFGLVTGVDRLVLS